MALTVETGAGLADADSYLSLADARTYAQNYGYSLSDDDTEAEVQLRKAAVYVDNHPFKGERKTSTQALDWPRVNVYCNGNLVDSDSVPQAVQRAQVIYASSINDGVIVRGNDNGKEIKLEEVSNAVKREFFETNRNGSTVTVTEAEDMLSCLLDGSANGLTFNVVRV